MRTARLATSVVVGLALLLVVPFAGAEPPGVTIVSTPSNPTNATAAEISFSSPDGAAVFECKLDSETFAPCASPIPYSALGEGSHTFTVKATNDVLEVSSADFTWTIDTTPPPKPTISGSPVSPGTTVSPTFTFTSEGATGFRCGVDDDTPDTTCDGGSFTTPAQGEGAHTFYVTAVDNLGNTSQAREQDFVIDTTPPPIPSITSGPLGRTNDTTPSFAFNSAGASAFTCSIDDGSPSTPCGGGTFSAAALGDGPHTFYVLAVDALGNKSDVASRPFSVDTVAPGTTISPVAAATSSQDITISFSSPDPAATFACRVDSGAFAACTSPLGLTGLSDATHTLAVKATDQAGNTDATPAAVSWIVDATPPLLTGPGNLTVEANGPAGSKVTFAVSGSDNRLALLPGAISCAPVSGAQFPLGQSAVTCTALDSTGNVGTLGFTVDVRDTTPPAINAPDASFTAPDASGITRTDPSVVSYLAGISATDLVSPVTVTTTTPDRLPIGTTRIVVTARDAAGNQAQRTATLTILEPGTPAPPPDFTPPGPVRNARATAKDRAVVLTWIRPIAADLASIRIDRTGVGGTASKTVFNGLANTFTSRGLTNAVTYRFVLVARDKAGNSSPPIVVSATPVARSLAAPIAGARVTKPPVLRWASAPAAQYFNVQLYRGGRKILSAWPAVPRLQLTSRWTYEKKPYRLKPGVYTWYVWPGVGTRSAAVYGPMLGKSSFVVMNPPV